MDRQPTLTNALLALRRRPRTNLAIAGAYYLAVVLFHPQVAAFSVWLFGSWANVTVEARTKYDATMTSVGAVLLVAYSVAIARSAWRSPDRWTEVGWLAVTTSLAITAFCTLVIMSVEVVHFPQYAVVAILLFPRTLDYGMTVCIATLLGAVDEAYQYWFLPHDASVYYYDFNDIVLNALGAAFGVVLIRIRAPGLATRGSTTGVAKLLGAAIGFVLALRVVGVLHFYPQAGDAPWILLNERPPPEGFWTYGEPAVVFHALQPVEGLVVVAAILLLYSRLRDPDARRSARA